MSDKSERKCACGKPYDLPDVMAEYDKLLAERDRLRETVARVANVRDMLQADDDARRVKEVALIVSGRDVIFDLSEALRGPDGS